MFASCSLRRVAAAAAVAACLAGGGLYAQQELVMEPLKDSGLNVYPAFEGWYQNPDGTYTLLIGYYNRNKKQILDVPIGPQNRIEPGGPDQGQPTHFVVGRGWGTTAIKVPKDFGTKKLTWTLTTNGKTVSIPFGLTKGYQIEPFLDAAMGNKPPTLKFEPTSPGLTGPPQALAQAFAVSGAAGEPVPLTVWITDDGHEEPGAGGGGGSAAPAGAQAPPARPRLSVTMSKFRGPGDVKFDDATPTIGKDGKATATATFSLPGEYFIRVEGNDSSGVGGGGFQCCWSTVYFKVTVKPGNTGH
ncbi:MAG TPA: hypothetical protein VFP85_00070 [Vicinamibacterales bacterium]|nr:hypothetical protein [Vicinamibacterales bacterium]